MNQMIKKYKTIEVDRETAEKIKKLSAITRLPQSKIIKELADSLYEVANLYALCVFKCFPVLNNKSVHIQIYGTTENQILDLQKTLATSDETDEELKRKFEEENA
jgi:hexokinase